MNKIVKNKWAFIAFSVKAVTGALGTSLIIMEDKWLAITVLLLGAIANEAIDYFDLKK